MNTFAGRQRGRRERAEGRASRRGVVLILVLGAIAVLSILAVEVSHRSALGASATARAEREGLFERGFQSGMAVAQALLTEGRNERGYDYPGDSWNRTVDVEPEPGVKVRVTVSDEAGKLNLSTALNTEADAVQARQSLRRLFEFLRREDSAGNKDWDLVEAAVLSRLGLSERKAGVKRPDVAPLLTLDGLREAGLTRAEVFGPLNRGEEPEAIALSDFLTAVGKGVVNLNTASRAVLYALDPDLDADQVDQIAAWRGDGEQDPRPFRKVDDLAQVERIVVMDTTQDPPVEVRNVLRKVQGRVAVQGGPFSARIVVVCQGKAREGWAYYEQGQGERDSPAGQTGPQGKAQVLRATCFEEIEP